MDSLVAAAIHDAKNSLNTLGVCLVQVRHEHAAQAKGAEIPALQQAEVMVERLTEQLVKLLALYRAGEGTLRMSIEDRRLDDFMADILKELSCAAHTESQIAVETVVEAGLADVWAFDDYLVKFVLLDALRNALRHARHRVRFRLMHDDSGYLRFSIEDDGPGYPGDILRYGQNENAKPAEIALPTGMGTSGSGLGLSFARLIAERHQAPGGRRGRLELANEGLDGDKTEASEAGARFSLLLP